MAQTKPFDLDELTKRMKGAVATLKHEFAGVRTGRASVSCVTLSAAGAQPTGR